MRILMSSSHRYPALRGTGSGLQPKRVPSGSGFLLHDLLVRGLAEMGHEVFYLLPKGADAPLPDGVTLISEPGVDVDIFHTISDRDLDLVREREDRGKAWVTTCHIDPLAIGQERAENVDVHSR